MSYWLKLGHVTTCNLTIGKEVLGFHAWLRWIMSFLGAVIGLTFLRHKTQISGQNQWKDLEEDLGGLTPLFTAKGLAGPQHFYDVSCTKSTSLAETWGSFSLLSCNSFIYLPNIIETGKWIFTELVGFHGTLWNVCWYFQSCTHYSILREWKPLISKMQFVGRWLSLLKTLLK